MEKLSEEKLKAIFNLMSKKLEEISVNDNVTKEIDERRKKNFDKSKPDSYFYEILVRDIFGASLKARALTARWPTLERLFQISI